MWRSFSLISGPFRPSWCWSSCWTATSALDSGRSSPLHQRGTSCSFHSQCKHWEALSDLQIFNTQFCCAPPTPYSLTLSHTPFSLRICRVTITLSLLPAAPPPHLFHWETSCIMFSLNNSSNWHVVPCVLCNHSWYLGKCSKSRQRHTALMWLYNKVHHELKIWCQRLSPGVPRDSVLTSYLLHWGCPAI